ncbi:hypothetical protein [Nocardia sp. BMG51109]|uniref:hypothetical protein n=1 Tax=Nocardia sp. BMG51109 TaxID=1056816 RepID=UPI0012EBBF7A|nr:hypothetical protein [Nocardia sp. BMG51109]
MHYRNVCALPARTDGRMITARVGEVGAVMLPIDVGHPLHIRLRQLLASCPVMSHADKMLTFLTHGGFGSDPSGKALLAGQGGRLVEDGHQISLPSPITETTGNLRWAEPPVDAFRPRTDTVLEILAFQTNPNRMRYERRLI